MDSKLLIAGYWTGVVVVILVILFYSHCANAQDSVQFHFRGHHFDRNHEYNESNYGVGYRSDDGYTVGIYRNSHDHTSVYIQSNLQVSEHVWLGAGGVTGYTQADVLPLLTASVRLFDGPVSPVITLAPTSDGGVALLSIDMWR